MSELFIELYSEEIPAKLQADARNKIKTIIIEKLQKKEIKFESAKSFSTPKRLVFIINGIKSSFLVLKTYDLSRLGSRWHSGVKC